MSNKSDMIFMKIKKNFSAQNIMSVKQMLNKATPEQLDVVQIMSFKSPMLTLIFSIFLCIFSVDRLYLGDYGLAVAKFFLGCLTFGIWYIADIVICFQKAQKINYQNLCLALTSD